MRLANVLALMAGIAALSVSLPRWASAGNILVVSEYGGMASEGPMLAVDSATGARFIVSGCDHEWVPTLCRGSGYWNYGYAVAIEVEADGQILVLEQTPAEIFRIDPSTGDSTTVASNSVGTGFQFHWLYDMALESGGSILVMNDSPAALLRVDGAGDRSVVSGASEGVGSGPDWAQPSKLATGSNGLIVVADPTYRTLYEVDPTTGDRSVLSGCDPPETCSSTVGDGPGFCPPLGLAGITGVGVESDGGVLVWDTNCLDGSFVGALLHVDPVSGDRSIVSSPAVGTGPNPSPFVVDLAIDTNGDALLADYGGYAIFRIERATGNRSIVSSYEVGWGLYWNSPQTITAFPRVHEPVPALPPWGLVLLAALLVACGMGWVGTSGRVRRFR